MKVIRKRRTIQLIPESKTERNFLARMWRRGVERNLYYEEEGSLWLIIRERGAKMSIILPVKEMEDLLKIRETTLRMTQKALGLTGERKIISALRTQTEAGSLRGGLTSFQIAEATKIKTDEVRRTLTKLQSLGKAYHYAPRKHERADGRDGHTYVWFRTEDKE